MRTTVGEIAEILGVPPPSQLLTHELTGFAGLREATPADVSFFANAKYLRVACKTQAGVLLAPEKFADETTARVVLRVPNPSLAFAALVEKFMLTPWQPPTGVDPRAAIDPTASLGEDVRIGPGVVVYEGARIGDRTVILANSVIGAHAEIGNDCFIHANVSVRERVAIGSRVILHNGAVIGSDGFGYEFKDGRHAKISQVGIVIVEDDVEIGANTTIDRARFGKTWIKEGTKIDNLVQIGHNVVIGRHCILVSGTGIAGSTVLGDYVTLGGQVGIAGHLHIGDRAMVGAQSGIGKDIPPGEIWFGSPAVPMKEAKRAIAGMKLMDGLIKRVRKLEESGAPSAD
jgi:UDP-3-O-[3-hydroxymyristoyl] glucosamine N-acyltransferase